MQGYWFLNEDRSESDGYYASRVGTTTGTWNYTIGDDLSGTWRLDRNDDDVDKPASGTWIAFEDEPNTFIDSTPANLDEACGYKQALRGELECVSGLTCVGTQSADGHY
jgi:hypothetical protein